MPGFCINNFISSTLPNEFRQEHMLLNDMLVDDYHVARNTINKFLDDKVFFQDEKRAFLTEGVTLNKSDLMSQYGSSSFCDLIIELHESKGEEFFSTFKGSFSGGYYDKQTETWTIWTNQTGESSVFYYEKNGRIIVASNPSYIISVIKDAGLSLSLNEDAIVSLLTYGYMYEALTPAQEVKRLLPGQYLSIHDNTISVHRYYSIPWGKYDLSSWSEEAILDEINKRFIEAVKLEYDKDIEYGYAHLADISGGLDCRMASWVAKKCGYSDITNVHYSQTGSNEEEITKRIVSSLGTELLYYPLDNHRFLYDAEEIIQLNYGLQLFSGITGGKRLLDKIDFNNFGIEHTGMIGDIVLSSALNKSADYSNPKLLGLYSYRNKELLNLDHLKQFGNNAEKQYIIIRGLLGALSSAFIRRHYTEIASPFMDIDFMEFCFSIPYKKRAEHNIYKKWILKYYPDAANVRWSMDDTKLTDGKIMQVIRRAYYHGPKKIARIIGIQAGNNAGMNPFEYWYSSDSEIEDQWKEMINKAKGRCSESLFGRIENLFFEGSVLERTQAISAALAIAYWMK